MDMTSDAFDLRIYVLALPITIALVQVLKQALMPTRWGGVAALGAGIVSGVMLHSAGIGSGPPALAALTGAIAGLSAAGVWSGTKAVREID
jgi:hypothetical protein